MTISVKSSGTWVQATPWVKNAGSWVPVSQGYVRQAGVWVEFFSAMSANASPASLAGSRSGAGSVTTSSSTTATATGGQSPYTYLWEFVSGDAGITINSPTNQTTFFSATVTLGQTLTAFFRCRVTDNLGTIAYTQDVDVSLSEVS